MPIDTSGSRQDIIKQEMHRWKHHDLHSGSERGPIVTNPKQAIAIAYSIAKRHGKADGGGIGGIDNAILKQSVKSMHTGAIRGGVPGRTDHVPLIVPNGSYVLPASHVSHLGQNNTEAGFTRLDSALGKSPFGAGGSPFGGKMPAIHHGRGPTAGRAVTFPTHNNAPPGMSTAKTATGIFHQGGVTGGGGDGVKIMAASGEYVVPPEFCEALGREALEAQHGDKAKNVSPAHALEIGHEILDGWVEQTKKKHIQTLQKLPGPSK
jgi:hypothetical protein